MTDMVDSKAGFASVLVANPALPAFRCGDCSATRAELLAASKRAAALLHHLGIERGDAICVWLPDGGLWLQILFACAQLGVLVVPISTRYRESDALHVARTARAKVIVVATDFHGLELVTPARSIATQLGHVQHVLEVTTANCFLAVDDHLPDAPETGEPTDALCTFSTSGTTGHPKLAVHDQASIMRHGRNVAHVMDIRPGDVTLSALSLYGVLGFVQTMGALAGSACIVYLRVFKADEAAQAIDHHGVTHLLGSDGIFAPILDAPGASLKSWRRGGFAEFAGMAKRVIHEAEQRLGIPLVGLYGSSECFALTATQPHTLPMERRALAGGRPIAPDIEFRIVDIESGQVLRDGERGELQIRGYNVMSGYLNNVEATASAFTADGWFRTGDLAYGMGDRFIYLSRLKDGLRLRGYLVEPNEIEEVLARHPALLDAQVVGVNRVGIGDMAVAFVRARDTRPNLEDLYAWCRGEAANYKVPSRIVIVDDYPRVDGPNGTKILKNKLRDMADKLIGEET